MITSETFRLNATAMEGVGFHCCAIYGTSLLCSSFLKNNPLRTLVVTGIVAPLGGKEVQHIVCSTKLKSTALAGAREMTGLGTERMPSGSEGPELGAQFAQLVKELRSEYAGAVTACAARIAQGVFGPSGRSILRILEQHGITGTPTLMQQQVHSSP